MNKFFSYFVILVFSITTNAKAQSKILTTKEVMIIEEQIDKELKSPKLNRKKKLIATTLAAREFYQYGFYDKSKKYYQAAISIDTKEDKSEAHLNLIAIALIEKNKDEVKSTYDNAEKYFLDNSRFKSLDVNYYLTSIKSYLLGNKKNKIEGLYGRFVDDANLVEMIKNKKYSEALNTIKPEALDSKGINSLEIMSYDVLNVVKNKKGVKSLYCTKEFVKYPEAYTYSVLLCGLLNDYLSKNQFDEKRLKRAESYFSQLDKEKSYLLDVVKEIQ